MNTIQPAVVYLPIIETGAFHDVALVNKRGLHDALVEYGCSVTQIDYLATAREALPDVIRAAIDRTGASLLITQLHGADVLTADSLAALRANAPGLRIVNWSGDSWLHSLTGPAMLDLCRQFDLQLTAAPDVLPVYEREGIRAAFWQIAYERPVGPLPEMPAYDVVFLGNVISDRRRALLEFLRTLAGITVGIYGDWQHADGHNTYDFGAGEALYRNARIAVADNAYPDQQNYVSNRPIQALMAGGALLFHQYVPRMADLLGLEAGRHYVEWSDFADLESAIRDHLTSATAKDRQHEIVRAGRDFAAGHHTYAARVRQLFTELLPEVSRAH
jgi:hypothetical protein